MVVEFIGFLDVSVMPQKTLSACKGSTGSQKSSLQRSYLPDTDPGAQREQGTSPGCPCRQSGSGSWVSVSARVSPRACRLFRVAPRACCREDQVLPLEAPEALQPPARNGLCSASRSPPCKGKELKCLKKEILLSRLNTPPLPSSLTLFICSADYSFPDSTQVNCSPV